MTRTNPSDMRGRLRAAFRARALYFSLHPQVIRDHQAAFEALRNPDLQNFMLFPFFVDGKPTSLIVAINEAMGKVLVTPLFVAADHDMELVPALDPAQFVAEEVTKR